MRKKENPDDPITILRKDYNELLNKAAKWDKLGKQIAEFYEDYDDDDNETPPKREGDLGDIGEVAAMAYGFL
jgi:hypothetical protein